MQLKNKKTHKNTTKNKNNQTNKQNMTNKLCIQLCFFTLSVTQTYGNESFANKIKSEGSKQQLFIM